VGLGQEQEISGTYLMILSDAWVMKKRWLMNDE
jgi:hypothetical protein